MSTNAERQARLNAKALARFGAEHTLNGVPVQGDFVKPGKTFTLSDSMEITARVPLLVVADGDVPAAPVGKAAICVDDQGDSANYTVMECQPDGHGLTVLELENA